MIYTNRTFQIQERELNFGKIRGIAIGERGRGRYEVFLPVPQNVTEVRNGMNENLSIGMSKNNKPRINGGDDGNLYLILSSEARYTRRGNGSIFEIQLYSDENESKVEVIAEANGADGDAGRIGSWSAKILKVKPGAVVKVVWGGHGYGLTPNYYFVNSDGTVTNVPEEEIQDYYDSLDMNMPPYFQKKFSKEEN